MRTKIIWTVIVALILLSLIVIYFFNKKELPTQNQKIIDNISISQSVKNKCQALKVSCNGDCFDGWSSTCFYDKSKNKESDFKLGFKVEPKNLCYAVFSNSICGECIKKFELKKESEFKEVSCEEFYQSIEDKNKECDNCLTDIMAAS